MRIFLSVAALLLASNFIYSGGHDASPPQDGDPSIWTMPGFDMKPMNKNHRDCSASPKPDFINELPYLNRQILFAIYAPELSNDILCSHTCSCELLHPEYKHAISVFTSKFVPLGLPAKPGSSAQKFIIEYKEKADVLYNDAVAFCIRLGVS